MSLEKVIKRARKLSRRYRVTDGKGFRLSDLDPDDTGRMQREDKERALHELQVGVEALAELQDRLYAQDRWSVLLIFQAMDAAGKDGAIKHVMSGVNPQGCQVASFKVPSAEELDHDFLWRCQRHLPERGRIGIFNRSYYEEVLVVKVHPELLGKQKIPKALVKEDIFEKRYRDIRAFERYLVRNGTLIRKFFLHVSRQEQKQRFLERLDDPNKNWKFSAADVAERRHFDDYMGAYQEMIRKTATKAAPWYVVPADHKWFTRVVVASALVETLAALDLRYPEVAESQRAELAEARQALLNED
jgi:PPK2 family polyphosphate:nucleotide phosphotransferase